MRKWGNFQYKIHEFSYFSLGGAEGKWKSLFFLLFSRPIFFFSFHFHRWKLSLAFEDKSSFAPKSVKLHLALFVLLGWVTVASYWVTFNYLLITLVTESSLTFFISQRQQIYRDDDEKNSVYRERRKKKFFTELRAELIQQLFNTSRNLNLNWTADGNYTKEKKSRKEKKTNFPLSLSLAQACRVGVWKMFSIFRRPLSAFLLRSQPHSGRLACRNRLIPCIMLSSHKQKRKRKIIDILNKRADLMLQNADSCQLKIFIHLVVNFEDHKWESSSSHTNAAVALLRFWFTLSNPDKPLEMLCWSTLLSRAHTSHEG